MKRVIRFLFIGILIICSYSCIVWYAAHQSWESVQVSVGTAAVPIYDAGNIADGLEIEQLLSCPADRIVSLSLYPHKEADSTGIVLAQVIQNGIIIGESSVDVETLSDFVPFNFEFDNSFIDRNIPVLLHISSNRTSEDGLFSVFYDPAQSSDNLMVVNDTPIEGTLCISVVALKTDSVFLPFCLVVLCVVLLFTVIVILAGLSRLKGKPNRIWYVIAEIKQYSFLVKQLVSRDFNTKYRQSVLGVLWSFLNPLLTSAVLYFVFSVLFKSNTENYAAYLMSGIVFWNFFTESSNLGMESITCNAGMISKVYVPKYIYPVSRVFSSLINLGFSMIPLIAVCLISGIRFTRAILLLPIPLLFLFCFACGITLLLSTANVFWRDTKFLWSVFTMMWTYLTPIFYNESIIPEKFIKIYHANPMYQFLRFFRSIIVQGVTPPPSTYLYSFLAGIIPLIFGIAVFRKNQDRFILYL